MKVKETAKKPYGICPASMTIWNADQTYNKKGMEKSPSPVYGARLEIV